jgi:toxin-antitoxin system PIN domain toxin
MTAYLFDVNLLLALSDPMHIHHEAAHRWYSDTGHSSWATCPITENGFLRIASHPNYPNRPGDVPAVHAILQKLCEAPGHQFWGEDISILDILEVGAIITHSQVTDVYLAGLAVHREGTLATLDRHIPVHAIRGGKTAVEIVPLN